MSGYAYQTVFAQPKLSIIGLVCRTRVWRSEPAAVTSARYCKRIFAVSVLPAPDSPEITTDCRVQQVLVSAAYQGNTARRVGKSRSAKVQSSAKLCGVVWVARDELCALGDRTWLCEFCIMPRCAEEATA